MLVYKSLFNEIEHRIRTGHYNQGQKLPSIQTIARDFGCSKSTVIRALSELEKQHFVYSVPKSGFFVVRRAAAAPEAQSPVIDFATTGPDPDLFPYLDFQHCINKAIDSYKNNLFAYGTGKGLPSLIQAVRKHLTHYQVFAQERQIFVVSGVQQALSLLALMPFPNKKQTVLVEQPGYHLFVEYLETYRIPVIGIKRTDPDRFMARLEMLFKTQEIKFFYTTPRFQNPLGYSYTKQEKKRIVELAHKYDVYLVEDDYLADFEPDNKADPLFAYAGGLRVVYLKSYSKIIFPGLRVGIAVMPESLIELFNRFKRQNDIDSSMLSQAALEIYLRSNMFDHHRAKIRGHYAARALCLSEALQRESELSKGTFRYDPLTKGSIHTFIELHPSIPIAGVVDRLRGANIRVDTMDRDYLSFEERDRFLKINVTRVQERDIKPGIARIAAVVKDNSRF